MTSQSFNPLWFNIAGVVATTIAVIAIDGIVAAICHKFQDRLDPESKYFKVSKKEKLRLERIGVRSFKDYLPDLGMLVKFPKGKIVDPRSPEYLMRYIMESCSGEIGHLIGAFAGFILLFAFPLQYILCFGLPVAIVNFVLSLLPVFSLRYNRYRLTLLYIRLQREQGKASGQASIHDSGAK